MTCVFQTAHLCFKKQTKTPCSPSFHFISKGRKSRFNKRLKISHIVGILGKLDKRLNCGPKNVQGSPSGLIRRRICAYFWFWFVFCDYIRHSIQVFQLPEKGLFLNFLQLGFPGCLLAAAYCFSCSNAFSLFFIHFFLYLTIARCWLSGVLWCVSCFAGFSLICLCFLWGCVRDWFVSSHLWFHLQGGFSCSLRPATHLLLRARVLKVVPMWAPPWALHLQLLTKALGNAVSENFCGKKLA